MSEGELMGVDSNASLAEARDEVKSSAAEKEGNKEDVRELYNRVGKKILEITEREAEKFQSKKEQIDANLEQMKEKIDEAEDLVQGESFHELSESVVEQRKENGLKKLEEIREKLIKIEMMLDEQYGQQKKLEENSEQMTELKAENQKLNEENSKLKNFLENAKLTIKNLSEKVVFANRHNGDVGGVVNSFFLDQASNNGIFADNAVKDALEAEVNGEETGEPEAGTETGGVVVPEFVPDIVPEAGAEKSEPLLPIDIKRKNKTEKTTSIEKKGPTDAEVDDAIAYVKNMIKNDKVTKSKNVGKMGNSLEEFNDPETQAMARDIARKKAVDDKPYIPRSSTPEGQKKIKDYSTPEGQRRMKKAFSIENADAQKSKEDGLFEEIARGAEKAANEAIEGTDKKSKPESPKINPGGVDSAHFGKNAEYEGGYKKEKQGFLGRIFAPLFETDKMSEDELDRIINENSKWAERARKNLEENKNGGKR